MRQYPENRRGNEATRAFRAARDFLLAQSDPIVAHADFRWPDLKEFNWARDWFDVVAAEDDDVALWIATPRGDTATRYSALARRSDQVAAWLQACGVKQGERLFVLLRNGVALYEILLAAIKLGVVVVPSYVSISEKECADRLQRGRIQHLIADFSIARSLTSLPRLHTRIAVGGAVDGWLSFEESHHALGSYSIERPTLAGDPLFGYFTSGTTSLPKLVLHTHASYPVGHLSGMYWNGVRPGDVHLNVSSPGWAKHSWSSFFVPWNAQATIVAIDAEETTPALVLDILNRRRVSTFCAPPTMWRMLLAHGPGQRPPLLREAVSAGEPLDFHVIARMREAWGIDIRDGYGQTETTAQIGNPPGCPIKPGSMGRALPGYKVVLVDPLTGAIGREGEVCVDLRPRPMGLMACYANDPARTEEACGGEYYRTGDLAAMDEDGYITFIGRIDDVFKSFDHRISPFELERVLLGHATVAEAAVVPSPDPIGLVVPKAFVRLKNGQVAGADIAASIGQWMAERLPPEYRLRRMTFVTQLPKTASGKIRRSELRERESQRALPIKPLQDEFFIGIDFLRQPDSYRNEDPDHSAAGHFTQY